MMDSLIQDNIKFKIKLSQIKDKQLISTLAYYSTRPAEFINDLLMTYDPRKHNSKVIPFILFDRQKEYIDFLHDCYEGREDGLIEKCRDVGASWLNAGFTVWLFIFKENCSILWGANKMNLVDILGDMSSLLERIDFMLRMLPDNFKPNYSRNFGKILNLENGSQITGAGGETIGRGGRSSITFVDEAGFIQGIERVDASLSMNTDCQIWLSTPNGQNLFYKKRMSGAFKVFTFHWHQDPRKNQEWYDKQKNKLMPHIFAQEVLIDYSASVENQLIKIEWINSAIEFNIPASGLSVVGYDIADEGADDNALAYRIGSIVMEVFGWNLGTVGQSTVKVWEYAKRNNVQVIGFDGVGVGAGAKSKFNELDDETIHIERIMIGESAGDGVYLEAEDDGELDKTYKDVFTNMRSRLLWELRERFRKTYEHNEGIEKHSPDEMISIPANDDLIAELVSPTWELSENGKIKIESKKSMKKRGIASPNLMDAVMMSFYPIDRNFKLYYK